MSPSNGIYDAKVSAARKMPQTADLLGFPPGIAREQSVPALQFADRMGTSEPLRQHVDDRGRPGAACARSRQRLGGDVVEQRGAVHGRVETADAAGTGADRISLFTETGCSKSVLFALSAANLIIELWQWST